MLLVSEKSNLFNQNSKLTVHEGACCVKIFSLAVFLELCDKFKFNLDPTDFHLLSIKFDINNSGRFSYTHFLKHFVLTVTPHSPGVRERSLLPDTKTQVRFLCAVQGHTLLKLCGHI